MMRTKRGILRLAFFFGAMLFLLSSQADQSTVAEVLRLEDKTNKAIAAGDLATLDALMSEDYLFINMRGEVHTKGQVLKVFAARNFQYEFREQSELNVRVYGSVAVVTGRSAEVGQQQGQDMSSVFRFTRIYVRQSDQWVAVSLQLTPIRD